MSSMTVTSGIYDSYSHISSGKRINVAADDAAGLAIGKKMEKEERGLAVGAENTQDGIGVLNIADGAIDGMMDSLQRMRELALASMNGTKGAEERAMYQLEIDQLKEDIQSFAKNTSYNGMKLLDGSMADINLATNPDGTGMKISMVNSTLEALGIADFDVTSGDFDLDVIDNAMKKLSEQRAGLGASTNRLEHTYNYNKLAEFNQVSARSRIEDLDMPMAISEKKKQDLLEEYGNMMLKKKMEQNALILGLFR